MLAIFILAIFGMFGGIFGCAEEMDASLIVGDRNAAGASFFSPSEEDIIQDEETGLQIIKDVINVTFTSDTKIDTVNKIVQSVGGEIVGYDKRVNLYQIRFAGAEHSEIDGIRMKLLRERKEIEMTSKVSVSVHKDPYYVK